jgi:hypothetical protein
MVVVCAFAAVPIVFARARVCCHGSCLRHRHSWQQLPSQRARTTVTALRQLPSQLAAKSWLRAAPVRDGGARRRRGPNAHARLPRRWPLAATRSTVSRWMCSVGRLEQAERPQSESWQGQDTSSRWRRRSSPAWQRRGHGDVRAGGAACWSLRTPC